MRKTLAGALTLLVGVTGCSCLRPFAGAQPFDPRNPKVFVVASKNDPTHKYVVVDQEPIYFFREDGKQIPIRWELQTNGYKFDMANGIGSITTLSGAGGQVRDCKGEKGNDRAFICINENSASGTYKYTINVIAADKTHEPNPRSLDPSIAND